MSRNAWAVTIVLCVAVLAAGGVGVALVLHRGSGQPPTSAAPASRPPAAPPAKFTACTLPVVTCSGEMRTEPKSVTLSADGTGIVQGLAWLGWGSGTAHGTGTLEINDCSPNCAQGTFTGYPATVTLSDPTPYGSGGKQAYATMVVSAPTSSYGTHTYTNLVP